MTDVVNRFNTDSFISECRTAAAGDNAVKQIRAIVQNAVQDPRTLQDALGPFEGDDIILYEDETVSIQHCRFDPGLHVPPHDHRIAAIIGVYEGGEINHFYTRDDHQLVRKKTKKVMPGDVISMGPEAIHSVEPGSKECGYAIHVYLGPLSDVERSLYDWESGTEYRYTKDQYKELLRRTA